MADEGWICLPNDFIEWEWYGDANTVHLFVHLLLSANQVDKRWQGVEVKRGQLVCGRKELAERLGMSEQNVRTALDHLKSSNEVTIKTYSKFSLVTLNNWDRYQQGNQQDLQETPVKQGSTSRTRKSNQQNVAEVTSKVTSKEQLATLEEKNKRLTLYKSKIEKVLKELESEIIAPGSPRLPSTIFTLLPIDEIDFFMMGMEEANIVVSTGSSCKSRTRDPSFSLLRMGYSKEEALRAIRISSGYFTLDAEVERLLDCMSQTIQKLR
jgi:predicted transcriptional regulator